MAVNKKSYRSSAFHFFVAIGLTFFCCAYANPSLNSDWLYVGGDAGGSHNSKLTQINKQNVKDLKVAWEFHTGDVLAKSKNKPYATGFESES